MKYFIFFNIGKFCKFVILNCHPKQEGSLASRSAEMIAVMVQLHGFFGASDYYADYDYAESTTARNETNGKDDDHWIVENAKDMVSYSVLLYVALGITSLAIIFLGISLYLSCCRKKQATSEVDTEEALEYMEKETKKKARRKRNR